MNKNSLWQKLKDGIAEGAAGVKEAIREVYAVVKAEINDDLAKADCWAPHHEVKENGDIVLNKSGLFAAAAALAGARSDPDLTPEQKAAARRHLLRHYRELEEEPPESLAGEMEPGDPVYDEIVAGETEEKANQRRNLMRLEARITGEMRPEDIPLASCVTQEDLAALKKDDPNPMEVVVEIPVGKSKRGWNYKEQSLKDIVDHVNKHTLSANLGHQKPENLDTEFPPPVTHWVGAVMKKGKAYFRGVIDAAAKDLKRWIKAKRIKQVSIFGAPKLKLANGEVQVVGYRPLSIDWTPLDRSGMPTRVVAIGEMDSTFPEMVGFGGAGDAGANGGGGDNSDNGDIIAGELDGSYDAILEAVSSAAQARWAKRPDRYCYVRRVYPKYAIVVVRVQGQPEELYKVSYTIEDGEVKLGEAVKVEEKKQYVPVKGEQKTDIGGAEGKMDIKEMLAAIRSAIAKGEMDFVKVLGEIGLTKDQAVEQLVGEEMKALKKDSETLGKVKEALGVTGEMKTEEIVKLAGEMAGVWKVLGFDEEKPEDPAKVAGEMAQAKAEAEQAAREKMIDEAIKEKVTGEQAQALVKDLLQDRLQATEGEITKELVAGEIDGLLAKDYVKALIGKQFVDKPAGLGVTGTAGSGEKRQYTSVKTEPIA